MKPIEELTRAELGALVCSTLEQPGNWCSLGEYRFQVSWEKFSVL